MAKKIYIEEKNLLNIKEAMANGNVSHSNSVGIPDEMLNFLLKNKPSISSRWAVVFGCVFKYFEKKSYARDYYSFLSRGNRGKVKLIDLDKFSLSEENKPPYEKDEYTIGGEGGNNDFFHINDKAINENTFENWFSNSVLVDSEGKPIKMYHGTSCKFDSFSKDFIGSSGTGCYEGYGFNFTPAWSRAVSYSSEGNVIEAYLRATNPLRSDKHTISVNQLVSIIRKLDEGKPITDTLVPNYESPRYGENWDERYYNRAVKVMARNIIEFNEEYGDAGIYAGICESGSADAKKVIKIFEEMGYDSVIFFEDDGRIKTVIVFEPNQIKLVSNKTFNNDSDVMSENIETEVEANEIKLDSFKKNDILAPRIWDGFDLNPRARLKLLDIADDFWDFANVTWAKRKGIHLTGSICNFNWSKFSDIDLHIVVDFSEIDERKDFVQEYFDAKKNEWNNEHSNLKIYGYPVELYVEDVNAETASEGLYDLEKNDWIRKPNSDNIKQIGLDKYEIKNKSAKLMTSIDDLYDELNSTDDDAELREIGVKAHKLLNKIKRMRKFGLNRGGESDSFNIIYKVLRRAGYMDMLWDLSSELYDKLNSIDEIKDDKTAGIILEYLESNHNLPLYKYFEWAKNATDEDKARDLMQQCSDTAVKYLETRNACMCDDLAKLRIEFRKNNDVIYDEDFVDAFARGIAKNGLLSDLDFFMRYRGDFYDLPSWMTMEFNRIVKNEWCIHFCFDAYSIAREGFKWGTDDIGRLALTGAGLKKPAEGYNFAFPIGERHIDRNTYGSINPVTRERGSQEAVIFQTSGVEVYHEGDAQNQVVFWGPNAKNFIPIKYDREVGDWCIYGNKGQVLKSGSPSEILNWVLDNLPQYRKQIMVGKNGVNLKETKVITAYYNRYVGLNEEVVADGNAEHNPFKQRWKHEREVLINYLSNYGEIMTSKENGKQYKVLYDQTLSSRLGINYCICIQWNPMTMEPGNIIYVRAFDKFTRKLFKPEFDARGYDNVAGTSDDIQTY